MSPTKFHHIAAHQLDDLSPVQTSDAHYLVIAADLSLHLRYRPQALREFLRECCQNYKRVFVIAGQDNYHILQPWLHDPLLGSALLDSAKNHLQTWSPASRTQGMLHLLHSSHPAPSGYFSLSPQRIVVLGYALCQSSAYSPAGSRSPDAREMEHLKTTLAAMRAPGSFMRNFTVLLVTTIAMGPGEVEMLDGLAEGDVWLRGDEAKMVTNKRGRFRLETIGSANYSRMTSTIASKGFEFTL